MSIDPRLLQAPGDVPTIYTAFSDLDRRVRQLEAARTIIGDGTITGGMVGSGTITGGNIATTTITGANLVTGTITASQIAAGTITATQIAVDAINAGHIQAGAVTTDEIAANTITAGDIQANTITSTEIAAATITASDIAAHTITANEIAASTITTTEIAANTITANDIAAHTITASEITASTITSTEIAAATITGSNIAGNTITGSNLVAGTITATQIGVSSLSAISANLGTITAGTITGATFQSSASNPRVYMDSTGVGSVDSGGTTTFKLDASTGKLTTLAGVGGPNLLSNTRAEDGTTGWTTSASTIASTTAVGGVSGPRAFSVTSTAASGSTYIYSGVPSGTPPTNKNIRPAQPGESFTLTGFVRGAVARTADVLLRFYDAANTQLGTTGGTSVTTSTTSWQRVSVTVTAPASTASVGALFRFTPTAIGDVIYWTDMQLERGTFPTSYGPRPDEILPGTVTGNSGGAGTGAIATGTIIGTDLLANTITATQIQASTITSVEIASATITAGNIAANTITGGNIAASTLTADLLNVGNLSAISADLGSITAGALGAVTVTGATVQTAATGQRVVIDASGLAGYDSANSPFVIIPTQGEAVFAGAIEASGGVTQVAASSTGALTARKHSWYDTNESEIAAVFGALSTYPGTSTQRLMASATAPASYKTSVGGHANLKHYWRLAADDTAPDSVGASPLTLAVDLQPQQALGLIAGTDAAIKSNLLGRGYFSAAPGVAENVTTGLSVEYWLRVSSFPTGDVRLVQRSNNSDGSTAEYWKATYKGATKKLEFSILIGGAAKVKTTATVLAQDTTYHVVHTYDGANIRTYLNSVEDTPAVAQTGSIDAQGTAKYRAGIIQAGDESSGPLNPSAASTANAVTGGAASPISWLNVNNVFTNDGLNSNLQFSTTGQESRMLEATGFGFAIPSGATIRGIKAEYNVQRTGGSGQIYIRTVGLSKSGVREAGVKSYVSGGAGTVALDAVMQYRAYGSSSDLWGTSWTATDINNSAFGAWIVMRNASQGADSTHDPRVEHIRVTVWYSTSLTLDEVAVYNAALTTTVIGDHYRAGTTGVASGTATITRQVVGADGTSDFMANNIVSALPGSPYDGQVVAYQSSGMAADGTVWLLRYRAASSSSYKWEFIGGSPIFASVTTFQSKVAAGGSTFGNLTTVGPDITLPLAGDYLMAGGAHCHTTNAAGALMRLGLSIAGAAAFDWIYQGTTSSNQWVPMSREEVFPGRAANELWRVQYKADTAVQSDWERRYLRVTPIRVA